MERHVPADEELAMTQDRLLAYTVADAARAIALNGGTSEPAQWIATAVCSVVRSVLTREPSRLTSSKSFANAALVTSGGPASENCLGLFIVNGFIRNGATLRHCDRTGFTFIGGVA